MAILVQSNKKPSVTFPSQTGSIITFNSQFAGLPLKSCKVNIPVTQEGTGDPSPYNVRNFVGVSSLVFTANSVVRTFQFGQTIYAGELDVLTGIFTATHKGVLARDMGSWIKSSNVFYVSVPDVWTEVTSDTPTGRKPLFCSHFNYANSYALNDYHIGYGGINNNGNIIARYAAFSTASEFNEYITNNDVFIVYPLATPEVINLGGMNIETLQGENNLFASTGETTVSHIKIGG